MRERGPHEEPNQWTIAWPPAVPVARMGISHGMPRALAWVKAGATDETMDRANG